MPKLIDKTAKKMEIVESSLAVFARKGFKDTIMADIANSAGIGKGTVYEYFPNKQAIFFEVFKLMQEERDRDINKGLSSSPDPGKQLKAFITGYCRFYENLPEAMIIYIDFWTESMKYRMRMPDKHLNDRHQQIIAILEKGYSLGKFRLMETRLTATIIFSAIGGLVFQWITEDKSFPLLEAAHELAETLLNWVNVNK